MSELETEIKAHPASMDRLSREMEARLREQAALSSAAQPRRDSAWQSPSP